MGPEKKTIIGETAQEYLNHLESKLRFIPFNLIYMYTSPLCDKDWDKKQLIRRVIY